MKTKQLLILFFMVFFMLMLGCKEDNDPIDDNKTTDETTTFEMNITDAKCNQSAAASIFGLEMVSSESLVDSVSDIIDSDKLTKFEVSFSGIYLKTTSDSLLSVLSSTTTIDLREFRGTVKELLPIEISKGTYKGIVIKIDGVSIVYDNNSYTASTTQTASVTIGSVSHATGIPNPFTSELSFELPFEFVIADTTDLQGVRLFFDAETSCKEISVSVPVIGTVLFAGMRDNMSLSAILENKIQQTKYSPPSGIQTIPGNNLSYYGIHTFIDFSGKGGTINSHTSQHIFRGDDGTLLVDAEDMAVNINPLFIDTISATGETDVMADEVFKFTTIKTDLATLGYNLVSGKTYYFSLRKTWNITSNGETYNLTRICEPIPVLCP